MANLASLFPLQFAGKEAEGSEGLEMLFAHREMCLFAVS